MSDTVPTFESIHSEEYWQPIPPMHAFKSKNFFKRGSEMGRLYGSPNRFITEDSETQIKDIVTQSINQLFAEGPMKRIPDGDLIGGDDDSTWAVPGAVLLVDIERSHSGYRPNFLIGQFEEYLESEAELAMSAVTAFRHQFRALPAPKYDDSIKGSVMEAIEEILPSANRLLEHVGVDVDQGKVDTIDRRYCLMPYERFHRASTRENSEYTREVNLFGFITNKKGEKVSVPFSRHYLDRDGSTYTSIFASRRGRYVGWPGLSLSGVRVGQTVNTTENERIPDYKRIRSAYLCGKGVVETVSAKQRTKSRVWLGKLVTSPVRL